MINERVNRNSTYKENASWQKNALFTLISEGGKLRRKKEKRGRIEEGHPEERVKKKKTQRRMKQGIGIKRKRWRRRRKTKTFRRRKRQWTVGAGTPYCCTDSLKFDNFNKLRSIRDFVIISVLALMVVLIYVCLLVQHM